MTQRSLIDLDTFRAALKREDGHRRTDGFVPGPTFRVSVGSPKAVEGTERTIRFCFSDGSVDRAGDTIDPKGWDLAGFTRNPVALWAHNSWDPPIGRASNLVIEEGTRLMGDIEFASAEVYPFADTIYRLVKAGYINAVSVGFLPKDYEWSDDDDREWGIDFKAQELLEISCVPVPCNANALLEARGKGIDVVPLIEWAERTLKGGGKIALPRAELARLYRAAKIKPPEARADDDAMSEDDPSSGGVDVGTDVTGDCGRAADEECGFKNPEECATHAPLQDDDAKRIGTLLMRVARGIKAGRVLSAANEKDLRQAATCCEQASAMHASAMDSHQKAAALHKEAADCVKAVLSRHDDATAQDDDSDEPDEDDKAARKRKAEALKRRLEQKPK